MSKSVKAGGTLKRSPVHLLHRALQLGLDLYGQEVGAGGVTQRQYAVLAAVAANDGLSQTDLVRATGIDRSTVAELVARMTGADLLARQRAAGDGRTNMVRLTERGRETLEAASPRVARADKRLLKLLPGKKREDFVEMLQALIKQSAADGEAGEEPEAKPDKPRREGRKKAAPEPAPPAE
jgi:DNA-binding MarR family transcriptional regulator